MKPRTAFARFLFGSCSALAASSAALLLSGCGSSPAEKAEHLGSSHQAITLPLTNTTTNAIKSGLMSATTVSGGSGSYSCAVTTSRSGGATCTVGGGGVVNYTAGATAGYFIKTNNPANTYLNMTAAGGGPYVQSNGALGSELFIMNAVGSNFTFVAKSSGSGIRSMGTISAGNNLVGDVAAGAAEQYTRTDCNGSGNPGFYNRFGFYSASGTNKYWKAVGITSGVYTINTVSGGNGAACNATSGTAWEAFTFYPGTDVLTITDTMNGANTATVTVNVENPVSFLPSTATISSAPSTAISNVWAWGGSGVFTGSGAGCTVTTNASAGAGTCSVSGQGAVSYTPGAAGGTDVLTLKDTEGHTGTFTVTVAVPFALTAATSIAIESAAMASVTASGGTGPYSCAITSNRSGGTTCTVNGAGVVSYTAGPDAGYFIYTQRAPSDYLQVVNVAGTLTVESGGALGTQQWTLEAGGSGFTMRAGTSYMRYGGATGDYLVADGAAGTAIGFTPQDCNGSGVPTAFNRFGFMGSSGSNAHWKDTTPPYISSNNGGNGTACAPTSATAWEAFYLVNGYDVLTVSDSASHSSTVTVTVENPLAGWPTPVVVPTLSAMPSTFHVWGGSGLYTGGLSACTVTTNQSVSGGSCILKGSGWITYTTGASVGTDVLHVVDSEGHAVDIPITVVGNVTNVTLTPTQVPVQLAPNAGTAFSVSGSSGLTWSLVTNNSGGSINASTGVYTAGATGNVADLVMVSDGMGNVGYVSVNVGPGLTISPPTPHVAPSTSLTLSVSGGSGTGYTWSMQTNASGGSVVGGAYTAGATAGTDTVKVVDSVGNQVTVPITVSCGADSSQRIIYPYDGTVFPLGMLPPLIQWTSAATATHAKITLRYPAVGPAKFTWSELVYPNGPLTAPYNTLPSTLPITGGGRAQIPALVWRTFATAAAGATGSISVQMLESSKGTIADTIQVKFATAQLKGTIFYQSYDSKLVAAGAPSGATLAIKVGNAAPTVLDGNTQCRDCHSASADGTRLLTADGTVTTPGLYASSLSVNPTTGAETVVPNNNDGRFTWPAIYPDGSVMFTNAGNSPSWMSGQWAPGVATMASALYALPAGTALTTAGIPAGLRAMFPMFSTDGSKIAFNYNTFDKRSLSMMTVAKDTPAVGTWTFGTPVTLFTPPMAAGTTYTNGAGMATWPSFMPAGQGGIVLQNQVHHNCAESGSDGSTSVNSSKMSEHNLGALGELWWVNTAGTPLPTRLNNANGLGYLPKGPNGHGLAGTTIPAVSVDPTDTAGGTPTIAQFTADGNGTDTCRLDLRSVVGNGDDSRLNYKPTVNPTITGGYQWVVFMSRRRYGNVATINPYASDPRHTDEINATKAAMNGQALQPTTKKLWVAAMSTNPAAGSDPSFPAFYLDGQELYAGNSRSYWVLPQCVPSSAMPAAANLCTTTADCCQTTPSVCALDIPVATNPPIAHCIPTSSITCKADGAACNVDGDCCNVVSTGARCSGNVCTAPPAGMGFPVSASVDYDFVAQCDTPGTHPLWRFLQTQQIINGNSSIGFQVRSATTAAGLAAAMPASTHLANATAQPPMFTTGPKTVDQVLALLSPPQGSRTYLRVTATLYPSSDQTQTPVLTGITPTYDCMFDE